MARTTTKASKKTAGRKRIRRSPEDARALILEAASPVLAELGPDRAGLKDVAEAAGVSHALITHYFGTFDSLVEEVFELQMARLSNTIISKVTEAGPKLDLQAVIRLIFVELRKPGYGRLVAWALLSGRVDKQAFFPRRNKGLRAITDVIVGHAALQGRSLDRAKTEQLVVLVFCTIAAYAVAGPTLWSALGRRPSKQRDEGLESLIVEIVMERIGAE